jgi:hypothetical protein
MNDGADRRTQTTPNAFWFGLDPSPGTDRPRFASNRNY